MVQMFTDTAHPDAGNGLSCVMQLPYHADRRSIAAQANSLNLLESKGDTGTLLLGAWCPLTPSQTTLTFSVFVPNVLARWVLVENLISYMSSHSRFAAKQLAESRDAGRQTNSGAQRSSSVSSAAPPTREEALDQLRDLAKLTARTSSQVAVGAAKKGLAPVPGPSSAFQPMFPVGRICIS